jgi:hypothetical protein
VFGEVVFPPEAVVVRQVLEVVQSALGLVDNLGQGVHPLDVLLGMWRGEDELLGGTRYFDGEMLDLVVF